MLAPIAKQVRQPTMAERPQISVRFTKAEQKRLQRIAEVEGRTRAQWVRWVTLKALEEAERKAKEERH